jgi:hypothetical protein
MVLSDEEANFLTTMEASAPTQSQAKILMTADLLQALASKVTLPETAPITQADVLWICGAGHRRRYRKRPSWDDAIKPEQTYGSTSYTRVAKDWLPDESSGLHYRAFISNVSKPKATARYFWRLLRCSHSARVMAVEGEARGSTGRVAGKRAWWRGCFLFVSYQNEASDKRTRAQSTPVVFRRQGRAGPNSW